jgi:hypothetical protein
MHPARGGGAEQIIEEIEEGLGLTFLGHDHLAIMLDGMDEFHVVPGVSVNVEEFCWHVARAKLENP